MLRSFLVLLILFGAFSGFTASHAQEASQPELVAIADDVDRRTERLSDLEARLADGAGAEELLRLREEARILRQEISEATAPLRERRDELGDDLTALGPVPEEGEPAESPALQERREAINRRIARLDAALAQVALNDKAVDRILADIAERRRDAFTGRLLERSPSIISPAEWVAATETTLAGTEVARRAASGWLAEKRGAGELREALLIIAGALVLAIALLIPVRQQINSLLARRIAGLKPYPSRRVIVAAVRTFARVLPGVLGGFLLFEAFRIGGLVTEEGEALARAVWLGFIILLFADGVVNAVFAPRMPAWRVAPLATRNVLVVRGLIFGAAITLVLNRIVLRGAEVFGSSPSLNFVREGLVALILGALLFLLSRGGLWGVSRENDEAAEEHDAEAEAPKRLAEGDAPPGAPEAPAVAVSKPQAAPASEEAHPRRGFWEKIRLAGQVIGLLTVAAALVGYVDLAYYASTRAFALMALFVAIWSIRALMREGIRFIDKSYTGNGHGESDATLLSSWIGILVDILALALFVPPALLVLGAEWVDVRGWVIDAFLGFDIGNVRISFAKILSGIAIFAALLWATRIIQRTAETQLFPRSRMDKGVQNSLRTLIGYVGLIIAFAVGVGTLGFDLSNLAIIAGALSVGIGFGLQSIVNNFVSGLILLFERPIKVGDWIITSSGEGIVKRISVRSTEIETFDRSSVIVPNSELISSAVTNWTHKDRMGRLVIAVGASYSSDAAKVVSVLEDIARKSPDILNNPAPFVVFEDFGASSLDFTLRTYIRDVSDTLRVRTRLRIAIHERFKKEGIEIPFPQRDLNIRGLAEEILEENRGRLRGNPAAEAAE